MRIVGVGSGDGQTVGLADGTAEDGTLGESNGDGASAGEAVPTTMTGTIGVGAGDEVGAGCGRTEGGVPPAMAAKQQAAPNTTAAGGF
ncbi:MAG TPA: hypothetical protein VFF63_06400 [Candidatus Babeliales bacterium]|nr:hypothetical protein [Candidatus Babeliales bacterium]